MRTCGMKYQRAIERDETYTTKTSDIFITGLRRYHEGIRWMQTNKTRLSKCADVAPWRVLKAVVLLSSCFSLLFQRYRRRIRDHHERRLFETGEKMMNQLSLAFLFLSDNETESFWMFFLFKFCNIVFREKRIEEHCDLTSFVIWQLFRSFCVAHWQWII